jgi:hypothetical protein
VGVGRERVALAQQFTEAQPGGLVLGAGHRPRLGGGWLDRRLHWCRAALLPLRRRRLRVRCPIALGRGVGGRGVGGRSVGGRGLGGRSAGVRRLVGPRGGRLLARVGGRGCPRRDVARVGSRGRAIALRGLVRRAVARWRAVLAVGGWR